MTMPFDRLAYIDRLKEAGVEEPVARAHAQALREALEDSVATKADLEALEARLGTKITDLRTELKGDIAELRGEMAELRTELKGDIAELRTELKGDINNLRSEVNDLRTSVKSDIQRLDAKIDITARDLVIKGAGGLVILASLMIGLKLFG